MNQQTKTELFISALQQQQNIPSYQQNMIRDYLNKDSKGPFYITRSRYNGRNYYMDLLHKLFKK